MPNCATADALQALEQRSVDESMLISEMEITGKAFDSLQEQNSALPLSLSLV